MMIFFTDPTPTGTWSVRRARGHNNRVSILRELAGGPVGVQHYVHNFFVIIFFYSIDTDTPVML